MATTYHKIMRNLAARERGRYPSKWDFNDNFKPGSEIGPGMKRAHKEAQAKKRANAKIASVFRVEESRQQRRAELRARAKKVRITPAEAARRAMELRA